MKQVVILAGGKGTRLKSISGELPKPMVPILGAPLLQYLIEQCVAHDIVDIKLLVSYKKELYFSLARKVSDPDVPSSIFESLLTSTSGSPSIYPFNIPAICLAVNFIPAKV